MGSGPHLTGLLEAQVDKKPLSWPLHPPARPPQGAQNSRKGQGLARASKLAWRLPPHWQWVFSQGCRTLGKLGFGGGCIGKQESCEN